jgi:surfeit locus 1 family protein
MRAGRPQGAGLIAGLFWPTLLSMLALATLLMLGTWQLHRRTWKEGLLANIAERTKAEPVALSRALQLWRQTGDVEYLRVRLTGHFDHDHERHVYAVDPALGPGVDVYTPLQTPDMQRVLVNRGFVPLSHREATLRAQGQIGGEITLSGLVRIPLPAGLFVPASEPARNMFYWPDFDTMLKTTSDGGGASGTPAPFFVDAEALPANPGGLPRGGVTRLSLPNRHLEYALTWYGLALALIAVYFAFAATRLKARYGSDGARVA